MKTILIIATLILTNIFAKKSYYQVLKVGRGASKDEIKKSYKKLVRKFHPDRNPKRMSWAKNQFIEVSQAYEVLSDPKKKEIYDQYGEEGIKNFEQHGNSGGAGGNFGNFSGGGINIEDIIGSFFGGGRGRGGGQRQKRRKQRTRGNRQRRGHGESQDGFQFNMGEDGENFQQEGKKKETKKVLEHESFIKIESEDMLPDFDNLMEAYGLFIYRPEHISQKRRRQGMNQGTVGQASAEKLQSLAEKFGSYLKIGLLDCSAFEVACSKLLLKIKHRGNLTQPMYTVFGTRKRLQKLNVGRPDININKIVSIHVKMMDQVIKKIHQNNFAEFIKKNVNKKIVLLFTNKRTTSLLFMSLASTFQDKYVFAEIHNSQTKLFKQFGVSSTEVPKLMVLKDLINLKGDFFKGNINRELLFMFLNQKLKEISKQAQEVKIFTKLILQSGQCDLKDSKFCLIIHSGDSKNIETTKERLNSILKNYSQDPLKVFIFTGNFAKFETVFGNNKVVLLKGKRRKFKSIESNFENLTDQEIINFIDMGISGGFLSQRYNSLQDLFN